MAIIALSPGHAEARGEQHQPIHIGASTLPQALAELSRQAAVSIGTEGSLPDRRTPAIKGRLSVGEALARLLEGSGYVARQVGATAWRVERAAPRPVRMQAPESPAPLPPAVPIIVTAGKRADPLNALPLAVSVVPITEGSAFAAEQGTASIAADVEGLALTGLGPGRNRIFLRGIADSAFNGESQATVAVVLDEARLTYSAPDPDIRLVDMERVEILKGPQGSLYGTGVLGGIYHLVSRKAELDRFSASLSAGGELVAGGGTGASASGMVNLPLLRDGLGLRLVGYSATEPGWVDTGDRTASNESRVAGLRGGLGGRLGEWRIDLTAFAQWLESRDSSYVYAPGQRTRPAQLAEPHDNDLRHVATRIAHEAGPTRIVASSGMSWHEVNDRLDATVGAESFGLASPQTLQDDRSYRLWDNELRLDGRLGGSMSWLGGLSYIRARQRIMTTLASDGDALVIDDDSRISKELAAFGNVSIPLGGRLTLDAGARLFRSIVAEKRVVPGGRQRFEIRRNGMTPSLALSWRPGPDQLLFLRYGSAFRQGGSDISSTGQLERLKGDELAMIEAGWRRTFAGGTRIDLGTWYGWWENLQSDRLQSNGLIETENAGDARTMGGEASLTIALARGWTLEAGGNVTIARLTRNELGYELADRHLPVVPRYTLRGAVRHDFAIGRAEASLGMDLRYIGPSRLSFDPALDRPMGELLESGAEGRVKLDRLTLLLKAENIFGRSGDVFAFGNSLRFATMRQYTPQRPFRLSVSVQRGF